MGNSARFPLNCLVALAIGSLPPTLAEAADKLWVNITYLEQEFDRLPPLSLHDSVEIPDEGFAGARLGQEDNQTTGGFLGHDYKLENVTVEVDGDLVDAAKQALDQGNQLLVIDTPADTFLAIADPPEAENALLFSASA